MFFPPYFRSQSLVDSLAAHIHLHLTLSPTADHYDVGALCPTAAPTAAVDASAGHSAHHRLVSRWPPSPPSPSVQWPPPRVVTDEIATHRRRIVASSQQPSHIVIQVRAIDVHTKKYTHIP